MRELESLNQWANEIIGKYNIVSEGFDALNPVTGNITKDEIKRFRSGKPIQQSTQKSSGPSPEIREKLKQLRAEFAAKAGKNGATDDITEADQPPQSSLWSPLSATTRDQPPVNPKVAAKRRREAKRMKQFMGHTK